MSIPAIRKLNCALCCVILGAASVSAGNYSDSAVGTSAGKFLSLGSSARAAGMGEAYCAAAHDADAVRYNPAAMLQIEANSAQLMHANYLADTFLEQGAFARRMGENYALGLSILQMNYGDISQTDETGYELGTAHPFNLALTAAYAYKLGDFAGALKGTSLGFSVNYIRARIIDSAKTYAISLAALSPGYWSTDTSFAIAADNLAGSLKLDQKADPLPVAFRLGGLTHLRPDWILTLDMFLPRDNSPYAALGTEKRLKTQSAFSFAIRAGYNTLSSRDLTGLAGLSAGLGISLRGAALDYAFVPFGDLGYVHRFMLTFDFGRRGGDTPKPLTRQKKRAASVNTELKSKLEQPPESAV